MTGPSSVCTTTQAPVQRPQLPVPADSEKATAILVEAERTEDYDELDAMWRALGELSVRQRAVLVLRQYEAN